MSLPGGCAIGTRPVDLHLMGLKALGAEIEIEGGYVVAKAPGGLRGGRVVFPKVSVGATHNVLLAAALASGETVIENAAREPEVGDVAECLVKMGAKIEGIGTSTLRIQGVDRLEGAVHTVLPDRIETGTFAIAVAATGGDVELEGARTEPARDARSTRWRRPASRSARPTSGVRVARNGGGSSRVTIETQPFPGFPTDLQAQLMALMTTADGTSVIRETIFENRFMHVQELARLGADIQLHGDTRHHQGRQGPDRRAGDGHRPARLGVAGHRRPDGRGRDDDQPRLSPRPRLRAARAEALALRRRDRAAGRVGVGGIEPSG